MSLIIQHKTEKQALDDSKTGQLLNSEMINVVKEYVADKEKLITKVRTLTKILNVDSLSPDIVNLIIRPWCRANMMASWWGKVSWSDEKVRARDFLALIDKLEHLLKLDQGNINILMLFITSTEIDSSGLMLILKELKEFYNIFLNCEFGNGKAYSAKYFIRYGINSLFYMAKQMRLKEKGSPTQLNKYIHTITERVYEEINQDHLLFKKNDFLETFNRKRNIPLSFIYNPYCPINESFIYKINHR